MADIADQVSAGMLIRIESALKDFSVDSFQIWGSTMDQGGEIAKADPGDYLFLIRNMKIENGIEAVAEVPWCCRILSPCLESKSLSMKLWKTDEYPNIVLVESSFVDLKWSELREMLGYQDKRYDPAKKLRKYDKSKNWKHSSRFKEFASPEALAEHFWSISVARTRVKKIADEAPDSTAVVTQAPIEQIAEQELHAEGSFGACCEGAIQRIEVDRRERDSRIRRLAIEIALRDSAGKLRCQACKMSFEEAYGELGRDFIEAHHIDPLSNGAREIDLSDEASVKDYIALLCSNCHRMIHRGREMLTVEELRKIVEDARRRNS